MELDIYWSSLAVLVPLVIVVIGHGAMRRSWQRFLYPQEISLKTVDTDGLEAAACRFRKVFFRVYLVVMASEWLQGPYTYSLFRQEKELSQWTVALLFVTYYSSAAISALFAGYLADQYGRRAACLTFCVIHSLSSISAFFNHVEILIVGRVLGGIALTLLWTSFESWMITEYYARELDKSSLELSTMFGSMTTYNCINGIISGILGHCVVITLGSRTNPFAFGVLLNICAAILMLHTWNENKGQCKDTVTALDQEHPRHHVFDVGADDEVAKPPSHHLSLECTQLWILSFVSCCFEGAMFLVVYFWPSALQSSHDKAKQDPSGGTDPIPHGVIQACFMATMVLGAVIFNALANDKNKSRVYEDVFTARIVCLRKLIGPTTLLCATLLLCAIGFALAAACLTELHTFCVFLLIQFCSGIYIPSMALHRSMIVSNNKIRTSIYGVMKIPLFIFVIGALVLTGMGEHDGVGDQQHVFVLCAVLLLVSFAAAVWGLGKCTSALPNIAVAKLAEDENEDDNLAENLAESKTRGHASVASNDTTHVYSK